MEGGAVLVAAFSAACEGFDLSRGAQDAQAMEGHIDDVEIAAAFGHPEGACKFGLEGGAVGASASSCSCGGGEVSIAQKSDGLIKKICNIQVISSPSQADGIAKAGGKRGSVGCALLSASCNGGDLAVAVDTADAAILQIDDVERLIGTKGDGGGDIEAGIFADGVVEACHARFSCDIGDSSAGFKAKDAGISCVADVEITVVIEGKAKGREEEGAFGIVALVEVCQVGASGGVKPKAIDDTTAFFATFADSAALAASATMQRIASGIDALAVADNLAGGTGDHALTGYATLAARAALPTSPTM